MKKPVVVHAGETFTVEKRHSRGRAEPGGYTVNAKRVYGRGHRINGSRKLELTIDELFDLAEILDDICDFIEDQEEARKAPETLED